MYFAGEDSDYSVLLSALFNKATLVLNILQQEPLRVLQKRLNFRKTYEIYRVDVITRQWVLPFLRARQFICSPHALFSSTVRVTFLKYRRVLQKNVSKSYDLFQLPETLVWNLWESVNFSLLAPTHQISSPSSFDHYQDWILLTVCRLL